MTGDDQTQHLDILLLLITLVHANVFLISITFGKPKVVHHSEYWWPDSFTRQYSSVYGARKLSECRMIASNQPFTISVNRIIIILISTTYTSLSIPDLRIKCANP